MSEIMFNKSQSSFEASEAKLLLDYFKTIKNIIEKLVDLINESRIDHDEIVSSLHDLVKHNRPDGFYLRHLPQIDEILKFLMQNDEKHSEYQHYLQYLLALCAYPPLLHRRSDMFSYMDNMRNHFNFLGDLLLSFSTGEFRLLTKRAIEELLQLEDEKWLKSDIVKPDVCLKAMEDSKLTNILLKHSRTERHYSEILELIFLIVRNSKFCCYRVLEDRFENELLKKMNPKNQLGFVQMSFQCLMVQIYILIKDDHYRYWTLALIVKILWRLMTLIIYMNELPETVRELEPPDEDAMCSVRDAFRRQVKMSRKSNRERLLRNDLSNVLLASLIRSETASSWELVDHGIAADLASLSIATEISSDEEDMWISRNDIETDKEDSIIFKKTLLLSVAFIGLIKKDEVERILKDKKLTNGLLKLLNLKYERTSWCSKHFQHLFKYSLKALTHIGPIISDEFIDNNGSQRLYDALEKFMKVNFEDNELFTCLVNAIFSLSSANCVPILNDFHKCKFVTLLLNCTRIILDFEALSLHHQRLITYLLMTSEYIIKNNQCLENDCTLIVTTTIALLDRCLHPKLYDSEFQQSFLLEVASFIWKCSSDCPVLIQPFLKEGGLYNILDLMEITNLEVQNFYLALLCDMCAKEFCGHFLLSWKPSDKNNNLFSLLANIWRAEESISDVKKAETLVDEIDSLVISDNQRHYVYFIKSLDQLNVITMATIGSARSKIYQLYKSMKSITYQNKSYLTLREDLSNDDKETLVEIEIYPKLQNSLAMSSISHVESHTLLKPLTESRLSLCCTDKKIAEWNSRVYQFQAKLLEENRDEKMKELEVLLYEQIWLASLAFDFDSVEKLAFVNRTSCRDYKSFKTIEMMNMVKEEDKTVIRTFNCEAGVTNVFNQQVTVRSIAKKSFENLNKPVSSASSTVPLTGSDKSSLASYKSIL